MKHLSLCLWLALSIAASRSGQAANAFKDSPNGTVHQPSGVVFPARIGVFRRVDGPQFYDKTGRDVSMRYMIGRDFIADAYAYPVTNKTGALNAEFRTQQNAIRQINRNVRLLAQETVSVVQNGRRIAGKHASYELERPLQDSRMTKAGSQLYVFQDGKWFVAYRFSYSRDKGAAALKQVGDFMGRWQWKPGTTRI